MRSQAISIQVALILMIGLLLTGVQSGSKALAASIQVSQDMLQLTPVPTQASPTGQAGQTGQSGFLELARILISWPLELARILISWPVVIALVLLIYRKPFSRFLRGMSQRVTKLSLYQVSLELHALPDPVPLEIPYQGRTLTPADDTSSGIADLLKLIQMRCNFVHMVVDLKYGHYWLTSRLFLFAEILRRECGLKCIVFVHSKYHQEKRFIGLASPEDVRWALARHYPWLEAAYNLAYAKIFSVSAESYPITQDVAPVLRSNSGELDLDTVNLLVHDFIHYIQNGDVSSLTDEQKRDWVSLGRDDGGPWERAEWISGENVGDILGEDILNRKAWVEEDEELLTAERNRKILRKKRPFVALVDKRRVFLELVDRQSLAEQVVTMQAEATE
jgi:hypothetical protein